MADPMPDFRERFLKKEFTAERAERAEFFFFRKRISLRALRLI